jgi:hypothetical protein
MKDVAIIRLSKGRSTIVDKEDFEWLNQWKWLTDSKGYAVRHEPRQKNKVRKWIYMHRLINNTPIGSETDHLNRNKLDNRKLNLRTVTHQQNLFNLSLARNNTSKYRGVVYCHNKWQAQIQVNRKNIYLGIYEKIGDAIMVRKQAERIYHVI